MYEAYNKRLADKKESMKIQKVIAREIFDSRGLPTLECEIVLDTNQSVIASVPTGLSVGAAETFCLRDNHKRLNGKGVQKAVDIIRSTIAPLLINNEPNLIEMDLLLLDLDSTPNKSVIGGNTMLAVSTAVCKAQAVAEGIALYELIASLCDIQMVSIPFGMFNLINGGMHADNNMQIQEIMIMPVGMPVFKEAMEMAVTIFQSLKNTLKIKGKSTGLGDEGGFAPNFKNEQEALDILMEVIVHEGLEENILIALDVAASHFYNPQLQHYVFHGEQKSSYELVEWYEKLAQQYPLYAIEDGLSELDWNGWKYLTKTLGHSLQLIGDDIFSTNPHLIWEGIEQKVANAVLIKPSQIGTITQTLQAVKLCHEYDRSIIVSHRSGETGDSFIADLAIGCNAGQIKAGGCTGGERMAKYNRLLAIEEQLLLGD